MIPAGTSKELVARVNGAAVNALGHAAVKERFSATDLEPRSTTPEEFGAYVRAEIAKWAKVVKASGIAVE
jgi:tripartite-type tricarboxylate transporter receptor subunit TctC